MIPKDYTSLLINLFRNPNLLKGYSFFVRMLSHGSFLNLMSTFVIDENLLIWKYHFTCSSTSC